MSVLVHKIGGVKDDTFSKGALILNFLFEEGAYSREHLFEDLIQRLFNYVIFYIYDLCLKLI